MATDASSPDQRRLHRQALVWLAVILIAGFAIVFALDVILSRIAFPFVDSTISGTWLAAPWVVLVVGGASLLWRRDAAIRPEPTRDPALAGHDLEKRRRARLLIDRCGTALVAMIPGLGIGTLAVHVLNAVGDHSAPRAARYVVVGLKYGRSATYAELAPTLRDPRWPPLEAYIDILTPKPNVGDTVTVRVHGGRLGYPWVERYGVPSRLGTR
jgi:hypothetical protein